MVAKMALFYYINEEFENKIFVSKWICLTSLTLPLGNRMECDNGRFFKQIQMLIACMRRHIQVLVDDYVMPTIYSIRCMFLALKELKNAKFA